MARADGTIRVDILGDAKGLQKALGQSEKGVAGLGASVKTLAGAAIAGGAIFAAVDFGESALAEADRLGDATARLKFQLGGLAEPLEAAAGGFSDLGQSKQDMLELEAAFADIATALGISDPLIADMADDVAATAAAISLLTGEDAATIVAQIGKAAGGSAKPMQALGVHLDDAAVNALALSQTGKDAASALTDGEKSAARLTLILFQLNPKLVEAQTGEKDLEQRTAGLGAKWETFTGQVGQALEGPLSQMLDWLDDAFFGAGLVADALGTLPGAIAGIGDAIADILSPLARFNDLIGSIGGGGGGNFDLPRPTGAGGRTIANHPGVVTVNVNGGDPVETERAVSKAVAGVTGRNGITNPLVGPGHGA